MKAKYIAMVAAVFMLSACEKRAESIDTAGVDNVFEVERLFTHEGCTVYRFSDNGRARYYTNCIGSTEWYESCGNKCTTPSGVSGSQP